MLPATLLDLLHNGIFQSIVLIPLAIILLDVITGIMSATHRGIFDLARLPDFLSQDILKYAGVWALIVLAWIFQGSTSAELLSATLGMSVLSLSVLKSMWDNLHEVFAKDPLVMAAIDTVAASMGLPDPILSPQAAPSVASAPVPVVESPAVAVTQTGIPQPLPVDQWTTGLVPVVEAPK